MQEKKNNLTPPRFFYTPPPSFFVAPSVPVSLSVLIGFLTFASLNLFDLKATLSDRALRPHSLSWPFCVPESTVLHQRTTKRNEIVFWFVHWWEFPVHLTTCSDSNIHKFTFLNTCNSRVFLKKSTFHPWPVDSVHCVLDLEAPNLHSVRHKPAH